MSLNANQPALPRAITVRASVADIRQRRGPQIPHYNMALDTGRVYRFVEASTLTDDGRTVIGTNGQGKAGRWLLIREPIKGADLTDTAAQTIGVKDGNLFVLPAIPITQAIVVTLEDVNAEAGDIITLTRLDVAAFTVAVANGGPGGGTLVTFPSAGQAFGDFHFDGTNWEKMRAAVMLA